MKNGFVARKRWLSLLLAVSLLLGSVPLGAVATELPEEAAQMTEAPTEETPEAAGEATEAPEETPETTEETQPAEETPEVTQPAQAVPAAEEHVHDYQPQEKTPTCTETGYRGQVCTLCGDVQRDPVTTDITAAFRWTDGTMIQATTGARITHSTWMASDYVDISGCTQLRILTADTVTADSTIGLAFYDANKAYISGVVHTDRVGDTYGILTHELTVPENAVYIRSTWYSQNHPGYEPSFGEFSCSVTGDCIPATGHSYALTGHRDATCTAEGADVYTCGSCGHSYEEALTKGEHRYDDGVCTLCDISILGSDWIAPDFAQGDYTMVAIPDTQNLITYWPEIYRHQMQWIADNRDTLNIQAVLHMGDMVNNNTDTEWRICEGGTDILEASGIPWMPMRGNHDDSAWFNKYYDHATYGTGKRWFGGSYHADKLDHTYWFVNAGGREYLILSLGWAPGWEVLTWAQGIVEANPKKNVILVDHGYMDKDGTLLSKGDAHCVSSYHAGYPDGEDVWAAFKDYENVVLAMAGHIHNPDVITYTDTNGAGRDVTSLLLDRQNDDTANRYAMVALLTFHEGSNTVDINWYSTRYDALYKGSNQFSIDVPHVEREEQPEPMTLQYDDHYDITDKTVEVVEDGNGVVTIEGNYLVATGIGSARVRIDGTLYRVTVEKAKVNLVVIMGQSNAGNHFANATSDVTCPIGTAYWWGNGKGTAATEPVDYTQPSMGFHTPLLAELYAQSVAAGEPVKNVLIWQEGITSKNGKSITAWAPGASDTSGTDGTVTMIENCIAYYTRHSDKYEIAGKGVYWLQGESDTAMDPNTYTQRFLAVWNRLKNAGMEYVAFLRVRRSTKENEADHQDLHHSASLSAQIRMINENPEFYLATDLTENWVGTADTVYTVDISNYITMLRSYGGSPEYADPYGNKATFLGGKLTTTMKELYGSNNSCHYGKFGYGLIGADAAYNMYRALKETNVTLVMTDTSGHADRKQVLANGSDVTLDITDRTDDLSFRVECGSAAGTLKITAMRGREDITGDVTEASGAHFGALSTAMLMQYEADSLLLEYTTAAGAVHKAVCRLTYQLPEPPADYIWDFSQDLNARDAEGNVCNSFLTEALAGSYTLEDGFLVGQGLQLELEQNIHLAGNKNWSVEWKYGAFTNGAGCFLLCEEKGNVIGNRAIFHASTGQLMISDYADSQGYRNYTDAKVSVSENDCLRIVNRYDPETGKSTLSLWQNGRRVIDDFQLKGSINKADDGTDMTVYPLSGSFDFGYLGNTGMAAWLLNCQLDYLKISFDEGPVETLSLDYDDRYDITGKTVQILESGTPSSYRVGYGVAENTVPDTAVVELRGNSLVATGIGCARVRIDGTLYEITVTAAPINLLLLIGQSNMEGNEGEAKQSISCPDGMVYATYGDRYDMVLENATHYAPSALTGQYRTVNTVGGTDGLCDYPVYMLTREGDGRKGPDSGFAYEWVKQTGEKVWIVNAAHGGTSLNVWQPGTTQYEECQAMFGACTETLRKEIAAGHFTLNHMAYFWCQGCNDYDKTAKWYVENYLSMHESLKRELAFDHDSNAATPDRTFEFGGIIPVRVGHSWCTGYRDGIYTQTNPYRYYESYEDLRLSGPRVAQYWMTNNPGLPELWNVCTIGEDWVWMPDGTNGVTDYFRGHYPGGTVDYEPQVKQAESWYTPTTPNAVHDSIHYNQIGYNEVGREAVRNALILMGLKPDYEEETTVTLVNWTGFESAETVPASTQGRSATLVVPIIRPVTRTKTVQFTLSEGLRWEYYDLLADSVQQEGQLTAGTGEKVTVVKQAPGEYLADHLRQLPETVCRGVNLWNTLERDSQYFTANGWGKHTSGQVYSLTVPVKAGDRIYATSFGPAGENGSNADGIRCTFFGEYEVIRTMAPAEVYSEFAANGYLTAPEGAIAVNVPMWNTEDTNELYLLSIPHEVGESICSICGKSSHVHSFGDWETVTLPSEAGPGIESRSCACGSRESREVPGVWQNLELGKYLVSLPESYCGGTELWQQLPHTQTYFHSGTHWDTNTAADVWAVTVQASSGDRIWATSFGAAGENGHTSAGIRVTFFDAYGIAKTLTPTETYAEFKSNGYLTAPEGTVAVNVPMYGDTGNELYLLSAPHSWKEEGASIRVCSLCGQAEGGYRIEAPGDEVWIDGVKYAAREDKDGKFVQMECTDAQTLVVYSYKEAASSDPHTQYPTGMQVWRLAFENGRYVSTHMPELDNLLRYAGSSIRVTGVKGIRMITGMDKALRSALMEGKLGYTLIEYGTAVSWAKDLNGTAPVLGKGYTMHNFAYKRDTADPIFADTGDTIQYTNVLVGFTDDQLGKDLILRPYIILEDAAGERLTLYGGCVQRSIGYIAKQNQNTFPEGSKADAYIEDIISKVYG